MRFGISASGFGDLGQLVQRAQWVEGVGFSTFAVSDHLNAASPFVTLQAIASATRRIRLGTLVVNNDLRHPAVLAQDAATLDRLSGGRLELGVGAGWALAEYRRAGISYDAPAIRVERLRETVLALRALFSGAPVTTDGPHVCLRDHMVTPVPVQGAALPLLVGGNGDRVLALAAEHADIVSFTGFSPDREGVNLRTHFSRAGLADRVAHVHRHAQGREAAPELNLLLQQLTITDDREYLADMIAQRHHTPIIDVLACPFLAFGTVEEIGWQLRRLEGDYGIGYVTVFNQYADAAAAVMAALGAS